MCYCEEPFTDSYHCLSVGSMGWERIDWGGSKTRESQECQGEDAWAGVRAHAHKGAKQWHAQTLRTPQVVFTHQGRAPLGMCLLCLWTVFGLCHYNKNKLWNERYHCIFLSSLWLFEKCVLLCKHFWKLASCEVKKHHNSPPPMLVQHPQPGV